MFFNSLRELMRLGGSLKVERKKNGFWTSENFQFKQRNYENSTPEAP